jgi:translation initiation factor 3 subunit I
MAKWGPLD